MVHKAQILQDNCVLASLGIDTQISCRKTIQERG